MVNKMTVISEAKTRDHSQGESMWNLWEATFSASTSFFHLNFLFHHRFLFIRLSLAEWEMDQLYFIVPQIPLDYENKRKQYCLGKVHLRPACQVWVHSCNLKMAVDLNKHPLLYWNSNPRSIEVRPNAQLTCFRDMRFTVMNMKNSVVWDGATPCSQRFRRALLSAALLFHTKGRDNQAAAKCT
jgi:hypothetical protein